MLVENNKTVANLSAAMLQFLQEQTVATLSVVNETNQPECAACFYAFDPSKQYIIFKSKPTTQHIVLAKKNTSVAISILPDKLNKAAIKGMQINGVFLPEVSDEQQQNIERVYYAKYPFAKAITGNVWVVAINFIKFTDNTLVFGKKTIWER